MHGMLEPQPIGARGLDEEVEVVPEPLMAAVESARRSEVVADDMQTAHLLAGPCTRLLARLLAPAKRLEESAEVGQWRKIIRFLARVPLFRGLDKGELRSLGRTVICRHYAAGKAIVRQGQGGICLFIVVSGKAEAVRTRLDGTSVVVNTFGPTDYFGELAVLNDEPRTATVIAIEDTECLALASWAFHAKLARCAQMANVILAEQARRFQRAMSVLQA